jgi:N-acetyl-anhydromuramyl-L-alanine amidase AmpD
MISKALAEQFLFELQDFSIQAIRTLIGHGETQSPKHSGTFSPTGMTLHYTAGQQDRVESVLRYFIRDSAQVSSWGFILDGIHPKLEMLTLQFPTLAKLPATVIQFGPPNKIYWHDPATNRKHIGIDLRNAGVLNKTKNGFTDGAGRPYAGRPPVKIGKHWWEPYTAHQIKTTIFVCEALKAKFGMDQPERFIPHSASKGTKWDTGLALPINEIRGAVYGLKPPVNMLPAQYWEGQCLEGQPEEYTLGMDDKATAAEYSKIWEATAIDETPSDAGNYQFDGNASALHKFQGQLQDLGYHVVEPFYDQVTPSVEISTKYFQGAHGLSADGIPGPKTYAKMDEVYSRWYEPNASKLHS